MKRTVNERIKFLREHLGLSQKDFAAELDMSVPGVWKLENNDAQPRSSTLTLIASTFGVDREWLMNGKGEFVINQAINSDKVQPESDLASAWKSKADHLEKEVNFYRELLLNITGKASSNFHNAFGLIGFSDKKSDKKVVESVGVAA